MNALSYKFTNNGLFPIRYISRRNYNEKSKTNLNTGFRTVGVSEATQKKIRTACRVLSYAAKSKTVRKSNGTYITHLATFITLTLPSEQKHEDKEITKIILGDFLDQCRKRNILKNYVWRAEKQNNGNIHYHLLTDSFMYYSEIYRVWKNAIDKLGYLKDYSEKFRNMSFEEYRKQKFNKNQDTQIIAQRYAKGKRENWMNPPSIQVDFCADAKQVASYISKYTAKNNNSSNIVTGRVWSCSSSVSKAVEIFKTDQEFNKYWYQIGDEMMKRERIDYEFFSLVKFTYISLIAWFKDAAEYIGKKLDEVIDPCRNYEKYLGFISV